MAAFRYRAANVDGVVVEGVVEADSEREAVRQLRGQSLVPVEVQAEGASGTATREGRRFARKPGAQDLALLVRELATLLESGMPLVECVDSVTRAHQGDALGEAFARVLKQLKSGSALSAALADCGIAWPAYLAPMLQAGEQTGELAKALATIAAQMEFDEQMRQELRTALIYPAVLVVSGIGALLLIFIFVVPKFSNLLKSGKAEIPFISAVVLQFGLFVRENLAWIALLLAAGIALGLQALSRPAVRLRLLDAASRLPLVGRWLIESEISRWAALMGSLLGNRVAILRALELAAEGVRLSGFRNHLSQAVRTVRGGRKLAEAVAGARWLDATSINLIRVGESSGQLPRMFETLSALWSNRGRQRLKRLLSLLEPAAILIIGGVIGTVMVAIMLAITSLSNVTL